MIQQAPQKQSGMIVLMLTLAMGIAALCILTGCGGVRPAVVGQATLAPCPQSPNCVSSLAPDSVHAMPALPYSTSSAEAIERIAAIVEQLPRTRIISRSETHLYAEFTSRVWRFTDDVEFVADTAAGVIHFRSASRLGKSDLGVNRERMQIIADLFTQPNP